MDAAAAPRSDDDLVDDVGEAHARATVVTTQRTRAATRNRSRLDVELLGGATPSPMRPQPGRPPAIVGKLPMALALARVADTNRVGHRQPLPSGSIGGPYQLRRSSDTSENQAAQAVQHPTVGAAASRPTARSGTTTTRGSRLDDDSLAKTHANRVVTAQGRNALPTTSGGVHP